MANELDVLVILDRSGSMESAKSDHEGGLRSFVKDQADLEGDVRFTLVQFDTADPCEVVYDRVPIADVKDIRLIPRGGTPLLDAIGRAVAHLDKSKPDSVVCMVITDGQENASEEWTKARIAARVKELEAAGWTFLFLGANIDSFSEAGSMGFSANVTMDFANNSVGVQSLYSATSSNFAGMRKMRMSAPSRRLSPVQARAAMSYNSAQRAAAMGRTPVVTTTTTTNEQEEDN